MGIGISSGKVMAGLIGSDAYRAYTIIGEEVNVASRIAEYARPGEVLVSQQVVHASGGSGVRFSEIGPVELKGVQEPVRLHAAHRST